MDDDSSSSSQSCERVRSRWNPKPEQIVILESIFNSGMVNPRKDETVRIRKMLEQFGAVGDANVFYWFQNRRSRSRRRQRQIQASLSAVSNSNEEQSARSSDGGAIQFQTNFVPSSVSSSSSSLGGGVGHANDGLFLFSGPMGIDQNSSITSILCSPTDNSNLNCSSSGFITVFINGVAAQVPRGPLDMKAMFGPEDLVLYHSSGVPLPVNEYGFIGQSLQHGESYFLVSSHQLPQVAGERVSNKNMN